MILDPCSSARKPPKEAVCLIKAVEQNFDLSTRFRTIDSPDYLILTIGDTSRESIERSYEWLLSIIASLTGIINRLPSSAACFLLLKAYGHDYHSTNNVDLSELAAPLLEHVSDCFHGKLKEKDSILAADLLLKEIHSTNAEQRRCARDVLQNAFCKMDVQGNFSHKNLWLTNFLQIKHSSALLPLLISSVVSYTLMHGIVLILN